MEAQIGVLFFFMVWSSSAAGEVKILRGTEGGNITLPVPAIDSGYLSLGPKILANVNEGKIQILDNKYKHRLLWNRTTGLFTLTGLQRADSGIYAISSKSYNLTVHEPVSDPTVKRLSVSTESCTLLCAVDQAAETTLLWYKDEEKLNESSSALPLPLIIHRQDFNSSYRCVAASPAEKKTLSVTVKTLCEHNHTNSTDDIRHKRHHTVGIVISILSVVIVTLVAFFIKWKCLDKNKRITRQTQGLTNTEQEVQYTDIQICEDRLSRGGNLPGAVDSHLKTVYDQLEVHRMVPLHTVTADMV
ncbi:uncharacterized protein LOC108894777 isoform X1 [Lates calcarifer]|uniref:Uncharacterized protein LOC108894777 isoform X1 n=1 Tax=Lates calcarifer TaxID=8187 RepID=A0AAJ7VDW9_LATCA|nr:uncharacterized protein LOC108894777 isoform X1 [Lates calcarifer]